MTRPWTATFFPNPETLDRFRPARSRLIGLVARGSDVSAPMSRTSGTIGEVAHTSPVLFGHILVETKDGVVLMNGTLARLAQDEERKRASGEARSGGGLGMVTGLLLRRAKAGRAGVQGREDYEVIDGDGLLIGRISKATESPAGTPWMWMLDYGDHEDRTPTHGYAATREAAMAAFAKSWRRG
jgi:hypothetical protein